MPTYQYACTACGHELEAVQSFSDDALTQCPSCSGESLRKRFSAVGIVFKGSGFYRTDSRSNPSSSTSSANSSSSSSSTPSTSSSSSDSTPAKKTESKPAPAPAA